MSILPNLITCLNLILPLGPNEHRFRQVSLYSESYNNKKEILAKMTFGRCVKFSPSPIFAISRTLNEDI